MYEQYLYIELQQVAQSWKLVAVMKIGSWK